MTERDTAVSDARGAVGTRNICTAVHRDKRLGSATERRNKTQSAHGSRKL